MVLEVALPADVDPEALRAMLARWAPSRASR